MCRDDKVLYRIQGKSVTLEKGIIQGEDTTNLKMRDNIDTGLIRDSKSILANYIQPSNVLNQSFSCSKYLLRYC